MAITLLHLSDIHAKVASEAYLQTRFRKVFDAVRNVLSSNVVVMITGDLTQSGSRAEYDMLQAILEVFERDVRHYLDDRLVSFNFFYVPGNHDCKLVRNDPVRKELASQAIAAPIPNAQSDGLLECQSDFFRFSARAPGFAWNLRIGATVQFIGLNTAWCSQWPESPGILTFPVESIPKRDPTATLSVVAMHHPRGWLEPNNARAFWKVIDGQHDFVATGHEHADLLKSTEILSDSLPRKVVVFEAPAFAGEGGPNDSKFALHLIEVAERTGNTQVFGWDATAGAYSTQMLKPFTLDPAPPTNGIAHFSPDFVKSIREPGLRLTVGSKFNITLDKLFVFPDFSRVKTTGSKQSSEVLGGDDLLGFLEKHPRTLVSGERDSGKSALACRLADLLCSSGKVVIVIPGSKQKISCRDLPRLWTHQFKEHHQASPVDVQAFEQCDRGNCVLIVDDFDELRFRDGNGADFLRLAAERFSQILVFGDPIGMSLDEIYQESTFSGYERISILPFNPRRRERLINRWLDADSERFYDPPARAERVIRLQRTFSAVVGRNFVPPYPLYLLAILQADEDNFEFDKKASAQGSFYEVFIKSALQKGRSPREYKLALSFLGHLAFQLFTAGEGRTLTPAQFERIHSHYCTRKELDRQIVPDRSALLAQGVLQESGGALSFRYSYLFCYFCAHSIGENLHDAPVREVVHRLCREAYRNDSGDILLFLAHLTGDPVVIEGLIQAASSLYSTTIPTHFSRAELAVLGAASESAHQVAYDPAASEEHRNRALERLDQLQRNDPVQSMDQDRERASEVLAALKVMQVTGQLLKNFPSLDMDVKTRLLTTTYELGLRIGAVAFKELTDNAGSIAFEVARALIVEDPDIKDEPKKLETRIDSAMFGLARMVSFGLVQRIASAVGAKDLQPTYERVLLTEGSPSIAKRLIYLAIQLDHSGILPADSITDTHDEVCASGPQLAEWTVRDLTLNHLYLYPPTGGRDRYQKVLTKLKIKHSAVEGPAGKRRLLK